MRPPYRLSPVVFLSAMSGTVHVAMSVFSKWKLLLFRLWSVASVASFRDPGLLLDGLVVCLREMAGWIPDLNRFSYRDLFQVEDELLVLGDERFNSRTQPRSFRCRHKSGDGGPADREGRALDTAQQQFGRGPDAARGVPSNSVDCSHADHRLFGHGRKAVRVARSLWGNVAQSDARQKGEGTFMTDDARGGHERMPLRVVVRETMAISGGYRHHHVLGIAFQVLAPR